LNPVQHVQNCRFPELERVGKAMPGETKNLFCTISVRRKNSGHQLGEPRQISKLASLLYHQKSETTRDVDVVK